MSDSIQTTGKTVNDAVSEALLQLGLRRDEVEIKVLEEPKSGLLGFIGSRPAKVLVRKKPERKRGERNRGRGSRDENRAISLGSGNGDGGKRGRRRNERDDDDRQESKGRRDGGRDGGRSRDDQDGERDENRRSRRGRRGGRGRGGRGRDEDRGQDQVQAAAGAEQTSARDDGRRRDDDGGRDGDKRGRSRRGSRGRGRGRGRDRDDQNDVVASEVNGNVRDDDSRGNEREPRRPAARAETREVDGNRRTDDAPAKRSRSRRELPAAEVAGEHRLSDETRSMSASDEAPRRERPTPPPAPEPVVEAAPAPAPAAVATPEVETAVAAAPDAESTVDAAPVAPVVAKPKRGGWGGGLGARLPRRDNPAVKNRKPVEVLPDTPEPSRSPSGGSRRPERGRAAAASLGSADEIIVEAVPATKYAEALAGVTEAGLNDALRELTSGMLVRAGFPCDVTVEDGEYRRVRIASDDEDDAGMLIGRHGQTVDAVEHLVERMASNAVDDRVRMNLDINSYRDRREEALIERADEAVAEVEETGRPYHFESMGARERRVIHLHVAEIDGVTTFTEFGGGGKHVVVALADDSESGGGRSDEEE